MLLVFTEIIELNFCELQKFTKKNITQRSMAQTKIDLKDEINDGLMKTDDRNSIGSGDSDDDSNVEIEGYEVEMKNTFKTLKTMSKKRVGYLIVTKSHLVARDEYMAVFDPKLAHFQITVTTLDDQRSLTYEKASVPSKRIEAICKLQEAGFDVAIRLSPLIEQYMDFDKLNGLGIKKAVVEFLRVNSWIEKWFNIDYSKYTVSQSGYKHLPLSEKKRIISKIKIPEVTVCEDVTEHYKYWQEHFNPNPDDCCNLRRDGNE
jgi:DNA repair photolyase